MILQKFDPIVIYDRNILIWYFKDNLCLSIQTQFYEQGHNLDN